MKFLMVFGVLFLFLSTIFSADPGRPVSLTIYNDNLGVVRQGLVLQLKKGTNRTEVTDIPALIDPTSVHLLFSGNGPEILEQNFQFDLVSPDKLYERYLGENIRILTASGKLFDGKLLSSIGQDIILQDGTNLTVIRQSENILNAEFPGLPDGLRIKPTLVWLLQSAKDSDSSCDLSYMTAGFFWHAEYTVVLNDAENSASLSAWVSVENRSGASYPEASVKLVAGEIHRPPAENAYSGMRKDIMMAAPAPEAAPFQEKSFFEYHLYTLSRKTSLAQNEIKQIALFNPVVIPVKKIYVFDSRQYNAGVDVKLEVSNQSASGLGMPLPAGMVRIFKQDSDKQEILIGEDRIKHTPEGGTLLLTVGKAFDITAVRTQKNFRAISDRVQENTYEVQLKNRKKDAVEIIVYEPASGEWKITASTVPAIKKDAGTAEFHVKVDALSETVLTYTIITKW